MRNCKFKVGDLVRGTKVGDKHYVLTNSKMELAIVTRATSGGCDYDDDMEIRMLYRDGSTTFKREIYNAKSEYFELVAPSELKDIFVKPIESVKPVPKYEAGMLVTGTARNKYAYTNKDMTEGKILSVDEDGEGVVVIIKHRTMPRMVGSKFNVKLDKFDILPPKVKPVKVVAPAQLYRIKSTELGNFLYIENETIFFSGEFGIAKRHPDDKNIEEVGDALAFKRAKEVK